MESIYILDAVNFLFRSYYAIGPMLNDKGESTSALFGFIRSVEKLFRDFSPSHVVAVFDGPDNKRSRKAIYADYKMHRKKAPEDLLSQFEWAHEWCKLRGISVLCIDGVEADDTMGSIAHFAREKKANVFLCTSDKDLMQLVDDKVKILQLHKDNKIFTQETVKEEFGVRPDQMIDYLAIVGDASDNIPGLEGFGPKTAAALLEEYDTLENILAHKETIKGEKKKEVLRNSEQQAFMSKKLATVDLHVEIPKEESFYLVQKADEEALFSFYQKMQFHSFLKEKKAPSTKKACEYLVIQEEKALELLIEELQAAKEFVIDTETTDLNPMQAHLVGIGFFTGKEKAYYLPFNGNLSKEYIFSKLSLLFQDPQIRWIGHHLKYDLHILENHGLPLAKASFDTLIASYLLNPQRKTHNLDDLSLDLLGKKKIAIQELIGEGKKAITMDQVAIEKVASYCCEDVDVTMQLKKLFEKELEKEELSSLFYDLEMPILKILEKMEKKGIFLDPEPLSLIKEKVVESIQKIEKKVFELAGESFNLNSPKQLAHLLFEKMQIPFPSRKKEISTSAEILEILSKDYPIAEKILEYRALEKLRSTYIEALPTKISPQTQRIHCTFSQSGTATGRLASLDPNLQNIPVKTSEGRLIRSCFRPQEKNFSFLGADYSQIELRLLAHFSQDPQLLHAFREGLDVHAHTASLIYGVPIEKVDSSMRSAAKTVNFGILYGQTAFGLSQQLKISQKEAAHFIHQYFERYPKIAGYLEESKESARKTGYAITLCKRKRAIPELFHSNPMIRAAAERLAINTPLQGTAADLIKYAMIAIDQEIEKRKLQGAMILQIHDELIFEVPDHEIAEFQQFVKEKMETVFSLKVPLVAEIAIGKNWAEC